MEFPLEMDKVLPDKLRFCISLVESLSKFGVPPAGKTAIPPLLKYNVSLLIEIVCASVLSNNEARLTILVPPASVILKLLLVKVIEVFNSLVLSLSLFGPPPVGRVTEFPPLIVSVDPEIVRF